MSVNVCVWVCVSECEGVCVRVCVSFGVIRCQNKILQLQKLGARRQTKKERI